MNYTETLDYIHSLSNFSMPAGLERIKKVTEIFGNPQNGFKSIHIAGTNGKGSVSAMLHGIFKTAGYKTGLFISPFVINFRERIQINGEFITENDLVKFADTVRKTNIPLTEFEFITAVAFLYFKAKNIDILICETGLGGRFDATNVLDNSVVNVITKIGLDHTAVLGETLVQIAFEKCGILRDCPTVSSPFQEKAALDVIKRQAKKLYIPQADSILPIKSDITSSEFLYKGLKYEISLCGDYQTENAVTAIEAANLSGYDIPYNIIYEGLKNCRFPARMEVISKNPLVILDGAHNPDGAEALAKEIKKYRGGVTAVIGMMRDKNCRAALESTLCYCRAAVAVKVPYMSRSLSAEELSEIANEFCRCETAENPAAAIEKALDICENGPIFIFGSLYLASAIRPILKEKFK